VALGTTVDEAAALLADVGPLPDALGQTAS
jgi:hypothetical protein